MVVPCTAELSCGCKLNHQLVKKIVLTGGPGAGKTAVLEILKKSFCEHIAILPESASIVFGGGFWRLKSVSARKSAQRAIFYVQKELENMVEAENQFATVLCDRGSLDGLAYWPLSEVEYWKELATTREAELKAYDVVIHLRTPNLDRGYNHSNPVRIESALEAAQIDKKIEEAWRGHPHRFFIESEENFLNKVHKTVQLIKNELPECCKNHTILTE